MTLLERLKQNKTLFIYLAAGLYLFTNNTINASTEWLEHTRNGTPTISIWEPFIWEYSSALAVLLLLPAIFYVLGRMPLQLKDIKKQLIVHFVGTIVFSLLHVTLMVMFRELVYYLAGSDYNFGSWAREFWYEYQKDAWGYIVWLFIYTLVASAYSRLKGEASHISVSENAENIDPPSLPEHFLVKKLDKEFLVRVSDIEWYESAGNYVNLHSQGRIYPLRTTLTQLSKRLELAGFSRIHRSFGINHKSLDNISYFPSGDGEITLKSGKKLNLSRRYKDAFKQKLS